MHRRRGGRVVALAACLLASACGGASGTPSTRDADAPPRTMASLHLDADSGESGLDDAGSPHRGGDLVYGLESETTGGYCLPSAQLAASGMTVARAIYDPLTAPDAAGGYVPYLARSITHDDDYRTWTITIRPGIRFHDGSALTAEVVKNNLDAFRGAYPARDSQLFALALDNIEAVTVTAPDTVEVTTEVPWVAFPSYLGGARLGMMAQAQLDDPTTCARKPIGTGPFAFESWTPNQKLVVTRNPDYWQKAPDGKPYPYLDRIEFRPITDVQVRTNALRAGDIDVLHTSNQSVIAGPLRTQRDRGHANLFVSQDAAEVGFIMVNHTRPPFDDLRMRKALAMSLDRERSNETDNDGLGTIASGPFAPGSVGYLKDSGHPTYDLPEAERLVADYVADGHDPDYALSISNDPVLKTQAEAIQQRARTVGIKVKIVIRDESSLINDAIAKNYQALFARNFAGGDPDSLYVWWYSGTTAADGTFSPNLLNFPGTHDAEMDRLLDEGRSEPDPAARKKIYEALNRRMGELVVAAWSFYSVWAIAERPQVHGVLGPPLPTGDQPSRNLSAGHPLLGLWIEGPAS